MNSISWRSLKIGRKIMIGSMLSILPMVLIVAIAATSLRDGSVKNSETVMHLVTRSHADTFNRTLRELANVFRNWTKEDVYGMAIEYQALAELQNDLVGKLHGSTAFCTLFLTDLNGKILISGNPDLGMAGKQFDFTPRMGADNRGVQLARNPFMEAATSAPAFLFSFQTHDSSGKANGFLHAFVDCGKFQRLMGSMNDELKASGLSGAQSLIVELASKDVIAHGNPGQVGKPLTGQDELLRWLGSGTPARLGTLANDYVIFEHLVDPALLQANEANKFDGSKVVIAAVVPKADVMGKVRAVVLTALLVGAVGVVLVVAVALFIGRTITAPLKNMVDIVNVIAEGDLTRRLELNRRDETGEVADAVDTMSRRMSEAVGRSMGISRKLESSATSQAASLEQTAASLEEMAAMTRQNAENANQANSLMIATNKVSQDADSSMRDLIASMREIAQASQETQKIVQTIDGIAFQTNLLALNAAVEAARAGEAGAGFAVVADEVRNLAKRAAEASQNTAGLIESTVAKVNAGVALVERTSKGFGDLKESNAKVGSLLGEISTASSEQANGIAQINATVSEMDRVTQENAQHAEELASSMSVFQIDGAAAEASTRREAEAGRFAPNGPQLLEE